MKLRINILFLLVFFSLVIYAGVQFQTGIVGATRLNGEGCLCHNPQPNDSVNVWVEGPDSLTPNQTALYKLYLTGGPAIAGGFNVAALLGNLAVADTNSRRIDVELTHNLPLPFSGDTVSWTFSYTAPNGQGWDTIYSVANSVNGDELPTTLDKWNFGENFPVKLVAFVPVELIAFSANQIDKGILLEWKTATELNNNGFEIERMSVQGWQTIGFKKGAGSTTEEKSYSFIDNISSNGKYKYRLKQVDFSGAFEYSNEVEVDVRTIPTSSILYQNYPNPFNPSTKINFALSHSSKVRLKIYNSSGELIQILLDETMNEGSHSVEWNAANYASGVYIYSLEMQNENGNFSSSAKKMILTK